VTLRLDGEEVEADRGEPLAASLIAHGAVALARSPKFHRPRGPSCFRGACDGCLARVDGVPNVMTCLVGAEAGIDVRTQNTLGSRKLDLLRMTDWFFPDGMNHHELFAGVPGLQPMMQAFARRVAGLGKLPSEPRGMRAVERRAVDVVVVGAGPSGLLVAQELSARGRKPIVVDDGLGPGGSLRALPDAARAPFRDLERACDDAMARAALEFWPRTTAAGMYGDDLLVVSDDGATVLEPSAVVFACGAHDGVLAFEGNDLPGVMSARAAGHLLAAGVRPGARLVFVLAPGGGPFAPALARAELWTRETRGTRESRDSRAARSALGDAEVVLVEGDVVAAEGVSAVRRVRVRVRDDAKGAFVERDFDADAVAVDAPRAPAYELALQAGARVRHEPRGYVVEDADGTGRIGARAFATGELVGLPLDLEALTAHARAVAAAIAP
jgi:sarcosine oxidase subunit alpha